MTDPAIATPAAPTAAPAPPAARAPSAPPPAAAPASASPPAAPSSHPGAIDDRHYDSLPSDQQSRFARVKRPGEHGGSEWVERAKLPSETAPAANPDGTVAARPGATVTEDGRLKIGALELSPEDVTGLMERHALEQGRKATMPGTAAEYSLDLPADFQMPEGQSFKFATDHPVMGPLIGQAKEFAIAHGLDQAAFSKMMSLYAASQVHEAQLISKAQAAEREKLGPMIAHRVDAVQQFIRGTVGDDKVAKALTQQILTADAVVGWEKIISKSTRQGAASFRQDGREPDAPRGRVSEGEYNAMSSGERYAYSKSFDQKQFQGR
jgi:hypothetical protein